MVEDFLRLRNSYFEHISIFRMLSIHLFTHSLILSLRSCSAHHFLWHWIIFFGVFLVYVYVSALCVRDSQLAISILLGKFFTSGAVFALFFGYNRSPSDLFASSFFFIRQYIQFHLVWVCVYCTSISSFSVVYMLLFALSMSVYLVVVFAFTSFPFETKQSRTHMQWTHLQSRKL